MTIFEASPRAAIMFVELPEWRKVVGHNMGQVPFETRPESTADPVTVDGFMRQTAPNLMAPLARLPRSTERFITVSQSAANTNQTLD